jgi:SAM-dependent methyltransferase
MKLAGLAGFFRSRKAPAWHRCEFVETEKGERAQRRLIDFLGRLVSAHIGTATSHLTLLDVGCGKGRLRSALPAAFDYVGLEYGQAMATIAQEANPDASIINASIEALPFVTNSFDVVVAQGVIETLRDPAPACKEMSRVARRIVLVTTPFAERDIRGGYSIPGVGWIRSTAWSRKRITSAFKGAEIFEESLGGRGIFAALKDSSTTESTSPKVSGAGDRS